MVGSTIQSGLGHLNFNMSTSAPPCRQLPVFARQDKGRKQQVTPVASSCHSFVLQIAILEEIQVITLIVCFVVHLLLLILPQEQH